MKTKVKLILPFLLIQLCLVACQEDELPSGGVTVEEGSILVWERHCDYHVIHVETDRAWKVETGDNWITLMQTAGEGKTELRVYVEQNSRDEDRTGSIRITPEGFRSTELEIRQKGIRTSDDNEETGMKNLVGMGYDITGGKYLDSHCMKEQIFNYARIEIDRSSACIHVTKRDTVTVTSKTNDNRFGDIAVRINGWNGGYSMTGKHLELYYSQADIEAVKRYTKVPFMLQYNINLEQHGVQRGMILLDPYLTEDFKNALQKIVNDNYGERYIHELFERFGTHVIIQENRGGSVALFMAADRKLLDTPLKHQAATYIGWKNKFSIPLDDIETMIQDELGDDYRASFSQNLSVKGGDARILLKAVQGGNCTSGELDAWGKSIGQNPELINVKLYPLWGVISYDINNDKLREAISYYSFAHGLY